MKKFSILGVEVSACNLDQAWQAIETWIISRKRVYICVAPVSTIVAGHDDLVYREILNRADMVTPDGMPVVWMGKLKGYKDIDRTYGPDLMLKVFSQSRAKEFKHYFYGGDDKTLSLLKEKLTKQFPEINIAGMLAPPFQEKAAPEKDVIDMINHVNPDILWVGLGSPKQDFWMALNREKINAPVMVGVGAAFDFLSGVKKQAPQWVRRSGLEWFFRLCCEPKRLWKRYLIGNSKFIYYSLVDSFKRPS